MAGERDVKIGETIGEQFLRRELWICDDCAHEFELGAAWFDPRSGIVCPRCKCWHIGPKRDQPVH